MFDFAKYPAAWGRFFSAAIGATISVTADILQKDDASALLKVAATANKHLTHDWPTIWFFLALIMAGVLLCFVFQPDTRKTAFTTGAGVIAVLMTAVPPNKALPLPSQSLIPTSILNNSVGVHRFVLIADERTQGPRGAAPLGAISVSIRVQLEQNEKSSKPVARLLFEPRYMTTARIRLGKRFPAGCPRVNPSNGKCSFRTLNKSINFRSA
jgi:hypothetical protein